MGSMHYLPVYFSRCFLKPLILASSNFMHGCIFFRIVGSFGKVKALYQICLHINSSTPMSYLNSTSSKMRSEIIFLLQIRLSQQNNNYFKYQRQGAGVLYSSKCVSGHPYCSTWVQAPGPLPILTYTNVYSGRHQVMSQTLASFPPTRVTSMKPWLLKSA